MMKSYFPAYTPKDLLALYTFTGGIPHYLEAFADEGNLSYGSMLDQMLDQQSFFLNEGKFLLIQEFGKDYATYFSILALIATGKTTRGKIESVLQKPIGGYLTNLQKDYRIINRLRPMFSKEGTTNVRYYIEDNFLNFWFRFFYRNDVALESRNFAFVREKIDRDYSTFAGGVLEKFIRKQLTENMRFSTVGNYWERGNKNEIDVIAFNELTKKAIIGEVKLNPKYISVDSLKVKAHTLANKHLKGYDIEYRGYSLADVMNAEL